MGEVKATKKGSKGLLVLRWIIFAVAVFILFAMIFRTFSKAFYTRHIVIEVTDKAVKNDKYMVYGKTVDPEHLPKSYEVTNSALANRYDSADLYGQIEVGKTYEFIVGGNRVGFMSWFPNIYSVMEVQVLSGETEYEEGTNG